MSWSKRSWTTSPAARRLVESITGGIMLGASDIAQQLDRLLERGDLVAVRERGQVRLLDAPTISDLRDLPSDDILDAIAPGTQVALISNPTGTEIQREWEGHIAYGRSSYRFSPRA